MKLRDEILIKKICEELDFGIELVRSIDLDSFLQNEVVKRAAAMAVINVGEKIKVLSDEFKECHKDIPWKEIAATRNVAAHKYDSLRFDDIYYTCKDDFPELRAKIIQIKD